MKSWSPKLLPLINRDHLPLLLRELQLTGTVVEVGTYHGAFAEHLLRHMPNRLVCVDPWEDLPDAEYRDGCANGGRAGGRNPMQSVFQEAMRRLKPYMDRVAIMRDRSQVAALAFKPASVDCVYIDSNHKFEHAIKDLHTWHEKVAPGGILGIHDCYIRRDAVQNCGVADAVWDFSINIGVRPFLTNCTSAWWIC